VSDSIEPTHKTRVLYVRVPTQIEQQVNALANRDGNTISSVVRRLLVEALRVERAREARDAG
jgi:hypothetical protein